MNKNTALRFFLKTAKPKQLLILCHVNADVDAIASALALFFSLPKSFQVQIGVPDHANAQAQQLAQKLNARFQINPDLNRFDAIILVDCNSLVRTGTLAAHLESYTKPVLIIDHHQASRDFTHAVQVIDPTAHSACLLVLNQLQNGGFVIPKKAWLALAAGLVSDSADLSVADAQTLNALSVCLSKTGLDVSQVRDLYSVPLDFSEKIARLKSLHRLRLFKANGFLVGVSSADFFESQIAMALLWLGADVALVAGVDKKTKDCHLSARATTVFLRKTKLHLARDVCIPLAQQLTGHGNGHAGAAFFSGPNASPESALEESLVLVQAFLKKKKSLSGFKELI